jgi:hypothetical protein
MIGKSGAGFSNHWKTCRAKFQSLEKSARGNSAARDGV